MAPRVLSVVTEFEELVYLYIFHTIYYLVGFDETLLSEQGTYLSPHRKTNYCEKFELQLEVSMG